MIYAEIEAAKKINPSQTISRLDRLQVSAFAYYNNLLRLRGADLMDAFVEAVCATRDDRFLAAIAKHPEETVRWLKEWSHIGKRGRSKVRNRRIDKIFPIGVCNTECYGCRVPSDQCPRKRRDTAFSDLPKEEAEIQAEKDIRRMKRGKDII